MFCTRCGQQNPPDALFCARCGAELVRPGGPVAGPSLTPHADPTPTPAPEVPSYVGGDDEGPAERTSLIHVHGITETGESEDAEDPDEFSAVDTLPAGSALLIVKRGPNAGSRFLLDQEVTTAGRHPESDIFLDDVTVSRRHAEFRRTPEGVFSVGDVGSLNGTYLNRERIDAAELSGGDEVQIGKFRLLFLLAGRVEVDAAAEAPAGSADEGPA